MDAVESPQDCKTEDNDVPTQSSEENTTTNMNNQPTSDISDCPGPSNTPTVDEKNANLSDKVPDESTEGPQNDIGQRAPTPLDSDQVVLLQTARDVALSDIASNLRNDLQDVQIIIDFEGNQIVLRNEGSEDLGQVQQQIEITEENGTLSPLQIQEIQSPNEKSPDEQQTQQVPASEEETSDVPVLFLVRAEDGSFHNVNIDIEKAQTEKVVTQPAVVTETVPTVPSGPDATLVVGEERPFQCDLCSATFTRLGNYTRHRMIHTIHLKDDNRYKCQVCGHKFLQRCDLKRHARIHEGNLPYKCELCGKGYVRRSDLVVHTRFHNNERSFACTQCTKAFYQSGDLQRHIRQVHERIKPLTCGHCKRKYSKEATLIRHMQTVHRDIILKSLTSKVIQPMEETNTPDQYTAVVLANQSEQQLDVSS